MNQAAWRERCGLRRAPDLSNAASACPGRGREARVLYAYKPPERSLGVAQGVTGGRIDAHLFAQPKIMLSLAGLTLLAAAPLVWRMLRPRRS